ncbi:MAG: hypothetical protein MUO35_02775, partial [Anaerolineales bacterium]|nr:hypothetical protein [Anaerolineales bacterium]
VNLNYEVSDPPGGACTATGNRGGGTFEVTNLRFETGRTDDEDHLSSVVDIQLTYGPGISTETIIATCPGAGTLTTPPTSIWSNTYMGIHQSELGGTGGVNLLATNRQSQLDSEASGGQPPPIPKLTIEQLQGLLQSGAPPEELSVEDAGQGATYTTKGWEVKGGELFAQKEWDLALSTEGVSLTEDGSFKLYHRPQ